MKIAVILQVDSDNIRALKQLSDTAIASAIDQVIETDLNNYVTNPLYHPDLDNGQDEEISFNVSVEEILIANQFVRVQTDREDTIHLFDNE